ncbi:MAG: hypothetical protein AB8B49_03095 [Nitratireductor sp.]
MYSVLSKAQHGQILPTHLRDNKSAKKTKLSKAGGLITAVSALLATSLKSQAKEDNTSAATIKEMKLGLDAQENEICEQVDQQDQNIALLEAIANFKKAASFNVASFEKLDALQTASLRQEEGNEKLELSALFQIDTNTQGSTVTNIAQHIEQLVGANGAANIETPHINIQDRAQSAIKMEIATNTAALSPVSSSLKVINNIVEGAGDSQNNNAQYEAAIAQLQLDLSITNNLVNQHETRIEDLLSAIQENEANYQSAIDALALQHEDALSTLLDQIEALEQQNAQEHANLIAIIESNEENHQSALEALNTAHEDALSALQAQIDALEVENAKEHAELIAAMQENEANHQSAIEALTSEHADALSALQAELATLEQENAQEHADLQEEISNLKTEFNEALQNYNTELTDLTSAMNALSQELESEILALTQQNAALIEENKEAIEALIESNALESAEADAAIAALNQLIEASNDRLNSALSELEAHNKRISELEQALEDALNNQSNQSDNSNVLFGTSSEDDFEATDADEIIFGMSGDDRIDGGLGADTIHGGQGIDLADYTNSQTAVEVNLEAGTGSFGHAEGDTYFELEGAIGSQFDDLLLGSSNADHLFGEAGIDTLNGGAGDDLLSGGQDADILNGEDGIDTALYTSSDEAINVSLNLGTGFAGDAAGDTLTNIENVSGSLHNDLIEGDNQNNQLFGDEGDDVINALGGDDTLIGGNGNDALFGNEGSDVLVGGWGADMLVGGEGLDTADYSNATEGVFLYKDFGGLGGEATGDIYDSIEIINGSQFEDHFVGSTTDDIFYGNAGNDSMYGHDGDDTLVGGAGTDTLRGGAGNDLFVFTGEFDTNYIADFESGAGLGDRIQIQDEYIESWDDLGSALSTNGFDVVLTLQGGSITIENTTIDQLAEDDFIFG